jgi:CheY-like chemotaxis protein
MVRTSPVLVVDDDRDVRDTLSAVLESEGYPVRCAANGAQALAALHLGRPVAIVLDLSMPVMSGWEFLDIMRSDGDLADVPIIVLSALRAPDGIPHLDKPVSADELVRTLDRICRR